MDNSIAPSNDTKNAYQEAIRNVNNAMEYMMGAAGEWLGRTETSIHNLGRWTPAQELTPPDIRPSEVVVGDMPTFTPPDPNLLGEVGEVVPPPYEDLLHLIDDLDLDDPGPFQPSVGLPVMPATPAPLNPGAAPERPAVNPVELPVEPDLTLPAAPSLEALTLPPVPQVDIPPFDVEEVPTFNTDVPSLRFDWQEQEYSPMALNELSASIKQMLAGGFAMPQAVQDALWAAAVEREDATARKAISAAADDWAARGYTMPPGMLVEQVNAVREQAALNANGHSRDVFSKAAEWAIENLRTAVAQGIALESMWSQHWQQTAQRAFQGAEVMLGAMKDEFNLHAAAFGLRLQSIQAKREVFEARLRAELAKLDILRAQIEAEQLKGTINEQRVRIYTSQLEGVKVLADMFSTRLQGAKIRSEIERDKIDAYKVDVEAWDARLSAEKTRFEVYDSQVRGEVAKVQAFEAEARAYAATVSAASDRNNSRLRVIEAKLSATDASVRKFLGLLQSQTAVVAARKDAITARAQTYAADTQRWGEQMRYAGQAEEIRVRAQEASVRNNIAYFEVVSRQFEARMQRLQQVALALKDAMSSAGQMSAQMAAGAMSAIHASASISGSGSASDSTSVSRSYNYSGEIADAS
ncbi:MULTISPECIES: hypothetical protein [Stenotrophomonas]|nr:hypothetical protein [Stenotrophomonas sp. SKA14]EED37784.1 conserved hypothetical protein [Stenotrophomonas sp. SKA14]HEL5400148.1 hypothetical protein [Stenotrophomonas maltophilia]